MNASPRLILAFALAALACLPSQSLGQSSPLTGSAAGHGAAGGGLFFAATDDSSERSPLGTSIEGTHWFLYGSVLVSRRIAVGAEYVDLGLTQGRYNAACCYWSDSERESAFAGTLRFIAYSDRHIGLELVGGLGVLRQASESSTRYRYLPDSAPVVRSNERSALLLVGGADVPIVIVRHLVVAPVLRIYRFQRESIDGGNERTSPSTRVMLAVTAGVKW